MKKLVLTSIVLGSVFVSSYASAGEGNSGENKIKELGMFGDVAVVNTGVHNNPPSCQSLDPIYSGFVINLQTPGGKEKLATALSAAAQGKKVWIQGTGGCSTRMSGYEDVRYIHIYYDR